MGSSIDLSEKSWKNFTAQASTPLFGILNFHHNLIAVPIITFRAKQQRMSLCLTWRLTNYRQSEWVGLIDLYL